MSSDSSHDVESASIVRFLRASPVYLLNRQRVRLVRPRGFWYLCVIEVPSGPLQFSSHLLKLINYQIKPVRHSHLLFPSRPNLKIRIRVIRSICSIAFKQIYAFWPALKLQTVHGRNVASQGKAEIGSSSVLVVSLYKYQVKTRILNKLVGYNGRREIHWHISCMPSWNTFLGLQVRVLILAFYTQQQQPATSRNNYSINILEQKAHLVV